MSARVASKTASKAVVSVGCASPNGRPSVFTRGTGTQRLQRCHRDKQVPKNAEVQATDAGQSQVGGELASPSIKIAGPSGKSNCRKLQLLEQAGLLGWQPLESEMDLGWASARLGRAPRQSRAAKGRHDCKRDPDRQHQWPKHTTAMPSTIPPGAAAAQVRAAGPSAELTAWQAA